MSSTDVVIVEKKAEKVNITPYRQQSDATRPVSFITEAEVGAMAEVARRMRDGERNELLILVTFQCALRISETLQITKQRRQIIDGKHRLFILGKGNKPRIISIPEVLSYRLGDYIGRHNLGDTERLFPITRQRAWRIIKLCAEKAGIQRRVYKSIR
ncbi:MAG: tyrosine-type recombinase/integrase [Dehalococcoidales bacterium]|nr:tyrosine-type recombinase/integrase [Dehalococcoidales bacterium]